MEKRSGTATAGSFPWSRWISLYCAVSFLVLGIDAAMHHMGRGADSVVLENKLAYIPLVFAPLACAACLACFRSLAARRGAWVVGLLAIAGGMMGEFLHIYYDIAERHGHTIWQALLIGERPPLAPAAFASTGILMLMVAYSDRRSGSLTPDTRALSSPRAPSS